MKNKDINNLKINHEFFKDGKMTLDELTKYYGRDINLGEIACFLSHHKAWCHGQKNKLDYLCIFEDDVTSLCSENESLELHKKCWDKVWEKVQKMLISNDPTFDIFYLGKNNFEPDTPIDADFVKCGFSSCLHGYIVSKTGI
eukprot:UN26776